MAGLTIAQTQSVFDSLQRMENKIDQLDEKIQCLERDSVKNDEVSTKVKDHEARLRELEKLAPAMKLVIWIAGILGVSVIGLLWAVITGQAAILFK